MMRDYNEIKAIQKIRHIASQYFVARINVCPCLNYKLRAHSCLRFVLFKTLNYIGA